jgi:hypothetical protein
MSHNDEERIVQLLSSREKVEGWTLPIDLAVPRTDVAETIEEMLQLKQLDHTIGSEDIVRDAPAVAAYQEVSSRPELQAALQKAQVAVKKWGF